MRKESRIIIVFVFLTMIVSGLIFYHDGKRDSQKKVVGIIQTVSYPALDDARNGFIEEMKRQLGDSVSFIIENGEGSPERARLIAEKFHADKTIDAIFAIATPALQSVVNIEKDRPVFVAAISAPEQFIVENNVYGTSDKVEAVDYIDMIHALMPLADTVAVMFNLSEPNSSITADALGCELQRRGYHYIAVEVLTRGNVASVVAEICPLVDVIVVPADNLLSSVMHTLPAQALTCGIPVIASDISALENGALAAPHVDYRNLGIKTAEVALQVLMAGRAPSDMAMIYPTDAAFFVNASSAKAFGLTLSDTAPIMK